MFHIIPHTGEPGLCSAEKEPCPYLEFNVEHYDTKLEAREAFERIMSGETSLKPLIKMDKNELIESILIELDVSTDDIVYDSIVFAEEMHANQIRKARAHDRVNPPYIEHPLRNALRLIRLGVTDHRVIKATLLHDTVEDSSSEFVNAYLNASLTQEESENELLSHIDVRFGSYVSHLVRQVTNPASPPSVQLSRERKNAIYFEHVSEAIYADSDTFLVKYSDFVDNAGSLIHSSDDFMPIAVRQAKKYLPVVKSFRKAHELHGDKLDEKRLNREKISSMLNKIEKDLNTILKTEGEELNNGNK